MDRKMIVVLVISCVAMFAAGFMTNECIDMLGEIKEKTAQQNSESTGTYTMVACNENTALLMRDGEVEGDMYISVDTINVRVNDGIVEWFDGYKWNCVDLVENLKAEDVYANAKGKLEEFEKEYIAEESLEGVIDIETAAAMNAGNVADAEALQESWNEASRLAANEAGDTTGTVPATTPAPTQKPTQKPTTAPTQAPTQATTAAPTQPPTQATTPAPTEPPTQAPTPAPTEPPTQAPTPAPTQPPTQAPTQPPTEPPTPEPTQPPTEPPTPAPTEPPTQEETTIDDAVIETTKDESDVIM